MASIAHAFHTPDGTPHVGLVAKRAYRLTPGGRCRRTSFDPEIVVQPAYRSTEDDGLELAHDSDLLALANPVTDVIVEGTVHVAQPAAVVEAAVDVGPVSKRVRVWGDRFVELDRRGGLRFSSPNPFTQMPLTWNRAYGGRDRAAEAALRRRSKGEWGARSDLGAIAYPRNPAGRGYRVARDASVLVGSRAPNFEMPADPVTADRMLSCTLLDWIDRPAAAGLGCVDVHTFPRAGFLVPPEFAPPTRPVYEILCGAINAADLEPRNLATIDPRVYSCASAGLGRLRLCGAEPVRLRHLHVEHSTLETHLPAETPTMLVEPPGAPVRRLVPRLAAVRLLPDRDLVVLTWAASLATACEFSAGALERVQWCVRFEARGARDES